MDKKWVGVVIGAASLAACAASPSTTTPAAGTVTSCARNADGYVQVVGKVQNLTDLTKRVEVTIGVFDALTGKQIDYTQAKSSPLSVGQSETYTAAVYNIQGGSSVPLDVRIQCRVTNIQVMDPSEVG
jgi:hypothetical protein